MTSETFAILATNYAALLVGALALWAASVRLRDASIVDVAWGPACALPGILTFFRVDGSSPRDATLVGLSALWALRLAAHLARRNLGHGEDYRYRAMRAKQPSDAAFVRWSLVHVFLLQATVAFFVSLPLQLGQFGPDAALGGFAIAGVVLFAIGFAFETIGDAQLAAFKRDPANAGRLMTQGLWSWTRHPNYFGDACVWIGLAMVAIEAPAGWIGLFSPALMTWFLYAVSGKALLERGLARRYPEFDAYRRSVSGFIPWPPRRDFPLNPADQDGKINAG